ncbi:MAG: EutN/CcmL family microcompartment protein [Planctomycetia bacterium]|nr:EutN/CcmL family microcompartment protein [Planctomycetia bacterium]
MFIAKIVGSTVATQKLPSMVGWKLLVAEAYRADPLSNALVPTGRTIITVDTLGAGEGDFVLICQGSSARMTPETKGIPTDAVTIGIIDTVSLRGKTIVPAEYASE